MINRVIKHQNDAALPLFLQPAGNRRRLRLDQTQAIDVGKLAEHRGGVRIGADHYHVELGILPDSRSHDSECYVRDEEIHPVKTSSQMWKTVVGAILVLAGAATAIEEKAANTKQEQIEMVAPRSFDTLLLFP